MAETEVESILREIRERVLSQQRAGKDVTATRSAITNGGNFNDFVAVGIKARCFEIKDYKRFWKVVS